MGYVLLPTQLKTINELSEAVEIESLELLWLPSGLQVTLWNRDKGVQTVIIDEDGNINGSFS